MNDDDPSGADATSADELDAETRATLRLSMTPGVGPRLYQQLVQRFGSAQSVFDAAPADLRACDRVGPKLLRAITAAIDTVDVDAELDRCRREGIRLITPRDDLYPRMLHEIHDPPGILFMRGALVAGDALSVAIVGSRHATRYGLEQAERLASGLARAGLTITSGLARGIDAAAHRGAIAAGGRTIAVLASGVVDIYPPEHKELAGEVTQHGALLSEAATGAKPLSGAFPQRNRIVTGISLGVIVVEAAERSGALISARHASEQGREVFAVPGRVDSRMSRGCHRLIRDGAKLVESVDDVLEELGPLVEATPTEDGQIVHHPAELQLERSVLAAIGIEPTSIDAVVAESGLPVHRVLSTVSVLEMRHLVRRVSGSQVVRI
jgi:DNA processing protein